MKLLGFQHKAGSWFEVHPEHRFGYMVSESVFLPIERVNLFCYEDKDLLEGRPEHRNITESRS